jgi:pyruvate,water dikinase
MSPISSGRLLFNSLTGKGGRNMGEEQVRAVEEPDGTRAMQLEFGDSGIFWFRDDLHNPYPISAFGMSTIQRGHMWGYALSADEAKLPPSRGAVVKSHKNHVYLGFVSITDPKEIGERAQHFGPFIEQSIGKWDIFYGNAMKEGEYLTVPNVMMDFSKWSYGKLAEHLKKCRRVCLRCWFLHFITMYTAEVVYMGGEQFVKERGMEEKDYSRMLKGSETKGLASDRGQFQLARSAIARKEVLKLLESKDSIPSIIEKIKQTKQGQEWWGEVERYLNEYGHRSVAAILDVNFPTWYEQPSIVVENVQNMIPRIKEGWDFEAEHENTLKLREEAIERFRKLLKPEDMEAFEIGLKRWQKAYQFNEDHWFYFEQMSWSGLHYAGLEAGRRFSKAGILETPEDVFHLTCDEVLEALECCDESPEVAAYAYSHLFRPLTAYRKKLYKQAEVDKGAPFVGSLPEKIEDPLAIKIFGLTDFVLERARKEMAGEAVVAEKIIKGFPGAPGVIEGPARVITDHNEFARLKTGDILVCPYTSPAWTPIFPKIKGVVTDSGGMLTHAAITAREYGIPAVVGTWVATTTIKNGDIIRINGNEGIVEILKKA